MQFAHAVQLPVPALAVPAPGAVAGSRDPAPPEQSPVERWAHRLEQTDSGRHRNVQALHGSTQRDRHEPPALLTGEAAKAAPLASEHERERHPEVGLVERTAGARIGADHRKSRFVDSFEGTGEVRHGDEREPFGSAARRLAGRRGQGSAPVLRDDDRVGSRAGRASHAGAEVARILNLVEHDEQVRSRFSIEEAVERQHRCRRTRPVAGGHALMGALPRHPVDGPTADPVHRDSGCARQRQRAAQRRRLAPLLDPHFQDPGRVPLDQGPDSVRPEHQA